ncbi:MerR family transcriptional regulator [bacterium]|nr:MerR family transcriptional regulator [bacterium]RQV96346.1 MAG: MerR family transcriptional regulator [bacterium]
MEKHLFILDELCSKANVSKRLLQEWEKFRLIAPVGFTDEKIPLYSESSIEKALNIQKLLELGYEMKDVQKIIKKIGMPQSSDKQEPDMPSNQYLTVGHLADKVGISPRTVKHWEDKGIIEPDMRSEGGFRLYSEAYVYLCQLIKDLQLFGYSLEEIKIISSYFRDFLNIQKNIHVYKKTEIDMKLESMLQEIQVLFDKMKLFKEGIQRWEDLLKKKKKEILNLKNQNQKRSDIKKGRKRE